MTEGTMAEDVPDEAAPDEAVAEEAAPDGAAPEAAAADEAVPEAAAPNEATSEGEALVEVEGLVKHYGPIRAVDGIDFAVRRGDILGFLGPNGAGKTTAMRLITGFLRPDAGRVRVAGHDIASESLAARKKVGYLPENAPAYGEMTVTGFLEFIAEARSVANPGEAISKVIRMTGLDTVQHQIIETLSKGYKRRVGLAQAMIHDPEVLILDEPTDGLDPNQKAMVHELISSLSPNKCIILSTHILDEVERICNRAMIISEGRILLDSTPDALIAQAPDHNVIRLTLHAEDPALLDAVESQPWCERAVRRSASSADFYPADGGNHLSDVLAVVKDAPIQSVHLQEGRLDDLFRNVTQGVSR